MGELSSSDRFGFRTGLHSRRRCHHEVCGGTLGADGHLAYKLSVNVMTYQLLSIRGRCIRKRHGAGMAARRPGNTGCRDAESEILHACHRACT